MEPILEPTEIPNFLDDLVIPENPSLPLANWFESAKRTEWNTFEYKLFLLIFEGPINKRNADFINAYNSGELSVFTSSYILDTYVEFKIIPDHEAPFCSRCNDLYHATDGVLFTKGEVVREYSTPWKTCLFIEASLLDGWFTQWEVSSLAEALEFAETKLGDISKTTYCPNFDPESIDYHVLYNQVPEGFYHP